MHKYEIIFIVRPDVTEEDLGKLVTQMEAVSTGAGGKIEKVERMGRRRLAYRVARQREGFYVLFVVEGSGEMVKEFERRLKVTDSVIKYLSVRTDEAQKRAEKFKTWRAKQAARAPKKPAAPAAASEPQTAPAAG
ncbi:MAG TPA: 30S ribosomal protein S6 [Terriglobia bacterium]|nr:30S ribosomal protein S6 [Terriglobia bacterium]